MNNRIPLKTWIERFKNAEFENENTKVQIEAGWYDWFCRDTSLKNKTKKMGNIIKQIKAGGKVNLNETYVWFKNNCPMSGPLYDDFRIANINDGATQLLVQLTHLGKIQSMWFIVLMTSLINQSYLQTQVEN